MTEISVEQRTTSWQDLRQSLCLTASRFGDALGIGYGKPYDFLRSVVDPEVEADRTNVHTEHGVRIEPIINDAYQLLTGNQTLPSGFWINEDGGPLHRVIGASPDAKVLQRDSNELIGLAEYKAPVYKMYGSDESCQNGDLRRMIPRAHMAQIQGQMAVCKVKWCDYMSLCVRTQEIGLYRVYFEPKYWRHVSGLLKDFCDVIQVTRERRSRGQDPLAFPKADQLKSAPMATSLFPGEDCIVVENMLTVSNDENAPEFRHFKSTSGTWMSFDFLVGEDPLVF